MQREERKERDTPTHIIKNSKLSHAGRVTKNKTERDTPTHKIKNSKLSHTGRVTKNKMDAVVHGYMPKHGHMEQLL